MLSRGVSSLPMQYLPRRHETMARTTSTDITAKKGPIEPVDEDEDEGLCMMVCWYETSCCIWVGGGCCWLGIPDVVAAVVAIFCFGS